MKYEDHPLASLLPLMAQVELKELAADIKANGLRAPVTLLDGKILDGRNRYRACKIANVEPKFREFNCDGDPVAFIVSANVRRRHLTTSQRALIAAKLLTPEYAKPVPMDHAILRDGPSIPRVAKDLNVSPRTVDTAKEVLREAPKREIRAIEQGQKTIATVARETKAKTSAKEQNLDKTGYPIPASIFEDWRRAEDFATVLREISKIKVMVEKALEEGDNIYAEVSNVTIAAIKNLYGDLKRVLPHAVCTACQGLQRDDCTLCKGRGFISEFTYTTCIAKSIRTLREKAVQHK